MKKAVELELKNPNSPETLTYLAFFNPKNHTGAIKFINGKKLIRHCTIKGSIERAKIRLLTNKFLVPVNIPIQSAPYKSDPQPIIDYISNILENRKNTGEAMSDESGKLSDNQNKALHMIMDSNWFRGFFSDDMPTFISGYHRENKEDSKMQIHIGTPNHGVFTVFSNSISIICKVAEELNKWDYRTPYLDDLTDSKSFDSFVKKWFEKNLQENEEFLKMAEEFKKKNLKKWGFKEKDKNFVERLLGNYHMYCIPSEIFRHVQKVGRRDGGTFGRTAGDFAKIVYDDFN